jgi:uncharacterized protein (DUF305 family)
MRLVAGISFSLGPAWRSSPREARQEILATSRGLCRDIEGRALDWSVSWAGLVAVAAALCAAATPARAQAPLVQPGAPGQDSRMITAEAARDLSQVRYTDADVRFMQGMIGHHAQALEMTALRPSRSSADDLRLLALRIDISQADEIRLMREWLTARGQAVPDAHAHHSADAPLMPGMLTPDEMARLAAARDADFDRLFLEFMIKHHHGALVMVKQLFESAAAGQESEVFGFVSEVEADQSAEIGRMAAMLARRRLGPASTDGATPPR